MGAFYKNTCYEYYDTHNIINKKLKKIIKLINLLNNSIIEFGKLCKECNLSNSKYDNLTLFINELGNFLGYDIFNSSH